MNSFLKDFEQDGDFLSPYLIGQKNLTGVKTKPVEEKKPPEEKIENQVHLPEETKEDEVPIPSPPIKPLLEGKKRDEPLDLSKVYNTIKIPELPVPDRIQPPPPPTLRFSDPVLSLKKSDGTPLDFIQKKYLELEIVSPEKAKEGEIDFQEIFRDGKEAVLARANKLLGRAIPEASRQRTFEMLESMIVKYPNPLAKEKLKAELVVLGEKFIRICKEHEVWIIILGENERLSNIRVYGHQLFGTGETGMGKFKRGMDEIRGVFRTYRPTDDLMWKIVIIGEELINGIYGTTSIHEFAHAYDYAWCILRQSKFGLSVKLWNEFYKERSGFITEYASTKPQEYFAESVEAFFHPKDHEKLKACDPGMYKYLQNLFTSMK